MKPGVEETGAHVRRKKTGRKHIQTATAVIPGEGGGFLRAGQSAPEGCVRKFRSSHEFHLDKSENDEGRGGSPGDQ